MSVTEQKFAVGALVFMKSKGQVLDESERDIALAIVLKEQPTPEQYAELGPVSYFVFDGKGRRWDFQRVHLNNGVVKEVVP